MCITVLQLGDLAVNRENNYQIMPVPPVRRDLLEGGLNNVDF